MKLAELQQLRQRAAERRVIVAGLEAEREERLKRQRFAEFPDQPSCFLLLELEMQVAQRRAK
jgi:hypothetical protein